MGNVKQRAHLQRACLNWSIAPAVEVNIATVVNRPQETLHVIMQPKARPGDKEIGKVDPLHCSGGERKVLLSSEVVKPRRHRLKGIRVELVRLQQRSRGVWATLLFTVGWSLFVHSKRQKPNAHENVLE